MRPERPCRVWSPTTPATIGCHLLCAGEDNPALRAARRNSCF